MIKSYLSTYCPTSRINLSCALQLSSSDLREQALYTCRNACVCKSRVIILPVVFLETGVCVWNSSCVPSMREMAFGDIKIAFSFTIDVRLSYELDAEVSQATPITLSWRTRFSLARTARTFILVNNVCDDRRHKKLHKMFRRNYLYYY